MQVEAEKKNQIADDMSISQADGANFFPKEDLQSNISRGIMSKQQVSEDQDAVAKTQHGFFDKKKRQ